MDNDEMKSVFVDWAISAAGQAVKALAVYATLLLAYWTLVN
jgi:hypothetical protein